jgi:hypothetical protein
MTTAFADDITMARGRPLILQLDAAGNPCRWINYEDAAYYYATDLIAWTYGDGQYKIWGGTAHTTGLRSSMELNTIIAVKGKIGDKHVYRTPALSNRTLFRRDQNICAYCGKEFSAAVLTRDHVHPKSRNGKDRWENVVTACGGCNKFKDDRTPEEAGMKLLYVPYAPSRAEYLILMNRTILADQMDFLKAQLKPNSRILNPIRAQ